MKLQKSSRLAIYALIELAGRSDEKLSVAQLANIFDISSNHLAKVMHVLVGAGMVSSARGASGGYGFCGNAKRTTLLDIILLFEDLSEGNPNKEHSKNANAIVRGLDQVMFEIDDIARATLGAITISTMLKQIKGDF